MSASRKEFHKYTPLLRVRSRLCFALNCSFPAEPIEKTSQTMKNALNRKAGGPKYGQLMTENQRVSLI